MIVKVIEPNKNGYTLYDKISQIEVPFGHPLSITCTKENKESILLTGENITVFICNDEGKTVEVVRPATECTPECKKFPEKKLKGEGIRNFNSMKSTSRD